MTIKNIILNLYRIFLNAKKNIHLMVFFFAIIICLCFYFSNIDIEPNKLISILDGISVLTSFFLLALQCINFKTINERFTTNVKISKYKENNEAVVIRCSLISLTIVNFTIIGTCYIFALFNINFIYLLIWSILYLFFSIIYTIILWNYTLSKE